MKTRKLAIAFFVAGAVALVVVATRSLAWRDPADNQDGGDEGPEMYP